MKKRLIQIYKKYEIQDYDTKENKKVIREKKRMLGFASCTYKNWKIGQTIIIKHKNSSIFSPNYHVEWFICKVTFKDEWQYLVELLNDGN